MLFSSISPASCRRWHSNDRQFLEESSLSDLLDVPSSLLYAEPLLEVLSKGFGTDISELMKGI